MTHHSPMGAWSSVTFGLPGEGVGVDSEGLRVQQAGDLVVAFSRGHGSTTVFPFLTSDHAADSEAVAAGFKPSGEFRNCTVVPAGEIKRTLTPATDEFSAAGMRFRITCPRGVLSSLIKSPEMKLAILPAVLVELEVDNLESDEPAMGFVGIVFKGYGRLRPLDWGSSDLSGVGFQDGWTLAAKREKGIFTLRCASIVDALEKMHPVIHGGGNEGGIAFTVPPRSRKTLTATLAFYRQGNEVTQGWESQSYAYTRAYPTLESAARAALDSADRIRVAAATFDRKLMPSGTDPLLEEMLAQASQSYYANSSFLVNAGGRLHWNVCEGQFGWRNTLDLAADHLPYELTAHPWVTRNVIDGFIDRYSYRDKVRFDGEKEALHPGGLSFTHDQGNYTAYSPAGTSGYEKPGLDGVYSFMTTEQLLNGAYCAAAHAIKGGDPEWARRRLPVARELVTSIENRDYFDHTKRNGILKGESDRVMNGKEITTYDALDPALKNSTGSLYIVVKTWCAALMLERWFKVERDASSAHRCAALADRSANALMKAFNEGKNAFPANLLEPCDSLVFAALDPLAVPIFCGLGEEMKRYPALLELLKRHAETCLRPGNCADTKNGGLRLSSSSANTWPSKVALALASTGWLEHRPVQGLAPDAYSQLASWMRCSADKLTVSDQINSSTGAVIGASYYPRLVTVEALLARLPTESNPPPPNEAGGCRSKHLQSMISR